MEDTGCVFISRLTSPDKKRARSALLPCPVMGFVPHLCPPPEDSPRGFLLCLVNLGGSCQAFDLSKDWLDSMSPVLP